MGSENYHVNCNCRTYGLTYAIKNKNENDAPDPIAEQQENLKYKRNYPTLKQGLRDPKFKNKRR